MPGSWSRRAVITGTVSIRPVDLTRVGTDARVSVRSPLLMNVYGSVVMEAGVMGITSDSEPCRTVTTHP